MDLFRKGRTSSDPGGQSRGAEPSPASAPFLAWVEIEIETPDGVPIATTANAGSGALAVLENVALTANGVYRVRVRASPGHEGATGNYSIDLWNATPTIQPLFFNDAFAGRIRSPYAVDRWTFAASEGQQVRLDLRNTAGPPVTFDLIGPDELEWVCRTVRFLGTGHLAGIGQLHRRGSRRGRTVRGNLRFRPARNCSERAEAGRRGQRRPDRQRLRAALPTGHR